VPAIFSCVYTITFVEVKKTTCIMRKLFILTIGVFALHQGIASAQVGLNSINISTTSEGNVAWSANVDGHNRKGYIDKNISAEDICKNNTAEKDVVIPVQSQFYTHTPSDVLFFKGTGYDNFTFTIKDHTGKTVMTDQYFDDLSLDISSFATGMYTIEIVAEKTQQTKTKKFTKE